MSDTAHENQTLSGHDEPTRAEADNVNMAFIGVFVFALLLVLVILVVGILNFFTLQTQSMLNERVYSVVDPEIQRVRVEEAEKLNHYRWVDQGKGVVQIPLDRALELTVAGWEGRIEAAKAAQQVEENQEAGEGGEDTGVEAGSLE